MDFLKQAREVLERSAQPPRKPGDEVYRLKLAYEQAARDGNQYLMAQIEAQLAMLGLRPDNVQFADPSDTDMATEAPLGLSPTPDQAPSSQWTQLYVDTGEADDAVLDLLSPAGQAAPSRPDMPGLFHPTPMPGLPVVPPAPDMPMMPPAGIPAPMGVNPVEGSGGTPVGLFTPDLPEDLGAIDDPTERVITELQQGDTALGGDAVETYSGKKPMAGARGKMLDWLGHDEESGSRLGDSLMAAGGAILSSDSPHWSRALGDGITAGTRAYEGRKQADLDDEVARQRLTLAQMEMEARRSDRRQGDADRARNRAWDIAEKQRAGWTTDDEGMPVSYEAPGVDPDTAFLDSFSPAARNKLEAAEVLAQDAVSPFLNDWQRNALRAIVGAEEGLGL